MVDTDCGPHSPHVPWDTFSFQTLWSSQTTNPAINMLFYLVTCDTITSLQSACISFMVVVVSISSF